MSKAQGGDYTIAELDALRADIVRGRASATRAQYPMFEPCRWRVASHGTRSATVKLVDHTGRVLWVERRQLIETPAVCPW